MSYAETHARALALVARKGAAVTFSKTERTYARTTGTSTVASDAVTGYAVQDGGDPERYAALGLIESEAPTLYFVPSTYGNRPAMGATCTWGGQAFTVKDVNPTAPDGSAIGAYVIVGR